MALMLTTMVFVFVVFVVVVAGVNGKMREVEVEVAWTYGTRTQIRTPSPSPSPFLFPVLYHDRARAPHDLSRKRKKYSEYPVVEQSLEWDPDPPPTKPNHAHHEP
jgi:hypothetical protein